MKHVLLLFLLLAFCCARPVLAQTPNGADSLRTQLDQVFAHLDKSQVPTGYLAEYAVPLLPLDVFNGTLSDSNRTNTNVWRQGFATLATSRIYGTSTLPRLDSLAARTDRATAASGAIPIALQRISYAALRPDAVAAGLLTVQNQQLYDVPGRSQSPYVERTLFVAGPARTYSRSGNVSFVFPQSLHVQSGGGSLRSLELDFGDGLGYRTAAWEQPLSGAYSAAGTYRVKVRVSYNSTINSTSTSYESHFDLVVGQAAGGAARYANTVTPRDFPRDPLLGNTSGGTAYIRYGGTHTQLIKPLIVVEGYDPYQVAPSLQQDGNYSIENFLNDISTANDFTIAPAFNFRNELDNTANYDIVFIDFRNGTDDIVRNAELFQRVVRWVNDNKVVDPAIGAKRPNVVLGISMGGLVARYGLAKMVKRGNDDPNTRLLLTQDSPHRGANTPLGIQALTRQTVAAANLFTLIHPVIGLTLRAIFPQLDQADGLLDAPATRQLLLLRALNGTGSTSTDGFITGDYRTTITFPAGGPQPGYRFAAVSLGSQCGTWTLQPYSELVRVEAGGFIRPSPFLKYGPRMSVVVNALPHYANADRVSALRLYVEVKLLFGIRFTANLFSQSFRSPANLPCWDGVPGGTQSLRARVPIQPGSGSFDWVVLGGDYNIQAAERFCFVPTVSALDIADITPASLAGSYLGGIATASFSRAANFIAQPSNDGFNAVHPFFRGRQAHWLYNEMEVLPTDRLACTTECSPYPVVPITGANAICANSSAVYSVVPPFGGVTSWSVSPTNLATITTTPTTGATSITLAGVGGNGVVTLTAQISNGCYSTTATRQVDVGSSLKITQYPVTGCGIGVEAKVVGTDKVVWIVNGQEQTALPVVDGSREFFEYVNDRVTVALRGVNHCTGTSFTTNTITKYRPTTGTQCLARQAPSTAPTATVYPNPARETVDVHVENASATAPVTVRLFDAHGQLRAEKTSNGAETVRLKTEHLPAGLYFVHILRGKRIFSRQQVQIEK